MQPAYRGALLLLIDYSAQVQSRFNEFLEHDTCADDARKYPEYRSNVHGKHI